MAKFKFSLEKVLTARRIAVDLAQKDFMEAQAVAQQFETAIAKFNEEKQLYREKRSQTVSQDQDWANVVNQINEFLLGQDLKIEQHIKRLAEVEKVVQKKREILLKALSEAKMIERIREKKLAEHVQKSLMDEQKEADEMVTLRARNAE